MFYCSPRHFYDCSVNIIFFAAFNFSAQLCCSILADTVLLIFEFFSSDCTMKFSVVCFPDDDSVEVVPADWMRGTNSCVWPNCRGKNLRSAIENVDEPDDSWKLYAIRVLGQYGTYEEAREKLNKAEDESALDSDQHDISTRSQRHQIHYDSDTEFVSVPKPLKSAPQSVNSQQIKGVVALSNSKKQRTAAGIESSFPLPLPPNALKKIRLSADAEVGKFDH